MANPGTLNTRTMALLLCLFLLLWSASGDRTPSSSTAATTTTKDEDLTIVKDQVSDRSALQCSERWTCKDYDDATTMLDISKDYYQDKSCACDSLCLVLQDCCPDLFESFQNSNSIITHEGAVSGSASSRSEKDLSEKEQHLSTTTSSKTEDRREFFGDRAGKDDRNANHEATSLDSDEKPNMADLQALYRQYHLTKAMFSCVEDNSISSVNSVSLVTACPPHYDVNVTQQCHNVTDDDMMTKLPVLGNVTGALYRNMYCALCHEEPFMYLTSRINCSFHQPCNNCTTYQDLRYNASHCTTCFQPPWDLNLWHPCRTDVVDTCSSNFSLTSGDNDLIASRCETDQPTEQLVFGLSSNPYRNEYCAKCNNVTSDLFCSPRQFRTVSRIGKDFLSFSIVLDINPDTGSELVGVSKSPVTVEQKKTMWCDGGHVFDPYAHTCRPVVCAAGRHFVNNTCMKKDGWSHTATEHNDTVDHAPLNCASIQINDTDIEISDDGTLTILTTNVSYPPSHYNLTGGGLLLCGNYSRNYTVTVYVRAWVLSFTFPRLQAIVSQCGLCLSLFALAVTIIVYSSVRALHTLPGRNILSLASSLFLAQALFLAAPLANEVFIACAVMGGAMHYFFLASFMWMNVMAVDVWLTFSHDFVRAWDRNKSFRRFCRFSCYAWLVPMVVVLTAVFIQLYLPTSMFDPGYGQPFCWISKRFALRLFFAAPLCFLLLLNILFFIGTAASICRSNRVPTPTLGRGRGKKMEVCICVKLTVVMGLTWILGFLDDWISSDQVLPYCFIVMNTLQGVFICLSFVCTRSVLRLVKVKVCGGRKKLRVSTQMTKSTRTSVSIRNMSLSIFCKPV